MNRKQLSHLLGYGSLTLFILAQSIEAQITIPRGRPRLNAARTTFVADNGNLLRGPYTSTEWTSAAPSNQIARIKELGFNAVHLYAEVFDPNYPNPGSTAPGYNMAEVDKIVQYTRDLGLYLIMTIGNGANNGNHNLAWATNFWKIYASRYANETHVIYEIHNEPVAWGPPYLTATTPSNGLTLEIECYKTIRSYAPNTPVLLFSYAVLAGTGGANAALTDIRAFNKAVFGTENVVWTNEAVAFHGYGGWEGTATAVETLINAGYPCFMTEFGWMRWGTSRGIALEAELTADLERMGVSWLTFQYIPPSGVSDPVTRDDLFKNVVENTGLSWIPDFGTWPPRRGVYGNNGQARATVANWVNDFLTGTLRIEAEDFDWGGEGISYHDNDPANSGGQYRPDEAVDIKTCTDTGGGYAVTTASGEWLEYTILVREPGWYDLRLRYATPNPGSSVEVISYATYSTGPRNLPPTGSYNTWNTATIPVFLGFGRQKLRLTFPTGGFDLNWLELSPTTNNIIPNGTYKIVNAATGRCIAPMTDTNLLQVTPDSDATSLLWHLYHMGGGQYKICAAPNNYSWNGSQDILNLVSSWSTSDDRCFIPVPMAAGFYRFLIVSSGLTLDVAPTNPSPVIRQDYSPLALSQQWRPIPPYAFAFPTGLRATASSETQVTLAWNGVPGATSYNVKRSTTSGGPYSLVATGITTTNFTDTVAAGTKYYYVVSAVFDGIESANSPEVTPSPPAPWQSQDIGTVNLTGSVTFTNGQFTVSGSGADIWGTADGFRFVYVPVSGNFTITARVLSVQDTHGWAKAGVMIRASLTANSQHAFVCVTPANGVAFQYRSSAGGNSVNINTTGLSAPYWVRLVRSGNTFTAYRSPDGVTWTQIGSTTISMGTTVYAGLAVTSHDNSKLCTAVFDNVYVPGWQNVTVPSAPTGLLATENPGKVALSWQPVANATSYNVKRAPLRTGTGNAYVLIANVTGTTYSDTNLANNIAYSYVVSAVNLAGESVNSAPVSVSSQVVAPEIVSVKPTSPTQVQIVWSAFTNATSYNVKRSLNPGGPYGIVATGVPTTNYTDTIPLGAKYYYVVSAVVNGQETPNSQEATFDLPYPWLAQDIGSVGYAGSATFCKGVFDARGSGADIWGTADAFRFIYMPVTGNCVITARILSVQNTDPWAKAGVMIRASLSANSQHAFACVTPGNGVAFQYRSTAGGNSVNQNTTGLMAPYWVRLVRNGNTFTAYRSLDGTNWTQQGSSVTISMPTTVYVGLALTAHNNNTLCGALFDSVTAPGWPPVLSPPDAPTGLTATPVSSIQINLSWNAVPSATGYNIKRSLTDGGPYTTIAYSVTGTNYCDYGLTPETSYYYVVSAVNSGGESTNSAQAIATTLPLNLGSLIHRYSFNEAGGSIVRDSIGGPAWDGTLPNGGTLANGQVALAATSSQYVQLPAGIVAPLSDFTIEAWVCVNSLDTWARVFDFGHNTTTNMFLTIRTGDTGTPRFAITTNGAANEQRITAPVALTTGAWHHIAVTRKGNTGVLYINGSPVATNNSMTLRPADLGSTAFNYLGKSQYSDPYLNGQLDEFRIYNVALTPSEIAASYALGAQRLLSVEPPSIALTVTGSDLTLSWPLECAGYTLQWRTNLTEGAWSNVTSPSPQIMGDKWQITLPISNWPTVFYRLLK